MAKKLSGLETEIQATREGIRLAQARKRRAFAGTWKEEFEREIVRQLKVRLSRALAIRDSKKERAK